MRYGDVLKAAGFGESGAGATNRERQ